MKNFNEYKFRCSALGNIVTKSGKLTDGAKTFLMDCFIESLYGVRKEAYGKAIDKGIACEQDGFDMLGKSLYPERFVKKITEPKENDFIRGTPDCIVDDKVWDIKNAFDRFTFGKAELSHLYEWQIRGYCMLYGKEDGAIFYCLNNMPDHMIAEEERNMFYRQRKWISIDSPDYLLACDELRAAHTYDSIPLAERFKIFEVVFTVEDAQRIQSAVVMGREYMNELMAEHMARVGYNQQLINDAKKVMV